MLGWIVGAALLLVAAYLVAFGSRIATIISNLTLRCARATTAPNGALLEPGAAVVAVFVQFLHELQALFAVPIVGTFSALLDRGQRLADWLFFGPDSPSKLTSRERSLSCPALAELENSDRAIDACTEMLSEFERHRRGRRLSYGSRMPRVPSMPILAEGDNEDALLAKECIEEAKERIEEAARSPAKRLEDELGEVIARHASERIGGLPHCVVLGDPRVGKSSVIAALEQFAAKQAVKVRFVEGLPCHGQDRFYSQVGVCLVVCDLALLAGADARDDVPTGASEESPPSPPGSRVGAAADADSESLGQYVERHHRQLCKASGAADAPVAARHPKTIVLANKSDLTPAPLTEIAALDATHIFVAGSAACGTNMVSLWRLIETCAAPRLEAAAPGSPKVSEGELSPGRASHTPPPSRNATPDGGLADRGCLFTHDWRDSPRLTRRRVATSSQ